MGSNSAVGCPGGSDPTVGLGAALASGGWVSCSRCQLPFGIRSTHPGTRNNVIVVMKAVPMAISMLRSLSIEVSGVEVSGVEVSAIDVGLSAVGHVAGGGQVVGHGGAAHPAS